MARAILRRELKTRAVTALRVGEPPLSSSEEDQLIDDVLATAFSAAPGLDRLLGLADVTDVFVNGCDDVRVVRTDGTTLREPPLASSDDELIEMIQTLARRGGHAEREFTPARPLLDLQLTDGSRLAAAAWVTKRPYLTRILQLTVGDRLD
jgi:Flp pilus assembly CpaF family ATPase